MYARSTILRAMPESIDDGIAEVRDRVVPALEEMPGFAGYSMLVDRSSGRCIVTTAWHDEDALAESRERVLALRRTAADRFGDSAPEVREWDIATLHRERAVADGAWARVTWARVPTDRVDRQIEIFKSTVLSRLQELPGFCSASLLVDRSEGQAAGAVVYESRAALEATREMTEQIRGDAVAAMGAEVMEVAEFEVAMAHLRVPERV
jgi:heme-degrading monooxygenase HmoA